MKRELDISINGFKAERLNPRQTLAAIFKSVSLINLWSYSALKTLYVESIKMVCELFENEPRYDKEGRLVLDKTLERFNILIKYMPKGRDKLLEVIYNTILSDDGLTPIR